MTVLYVLEKNVAHSKPLQKLLLPKKPATGFGQESKTQQAFLLFQMIQSYFQSHGIGPGLRVLLISQPPPLIPHLGLA